MPSRLTSLPLLECTWYTLLSYRSFNHPIWTYGKEIFIQAACMVLNITVYYIAINHVMGVLTYKHSNLLKGQHHISLHRAKRSKFKGQPCSKRCSCVSCSRASFVAELTKTKPKISVTSMRELTITSPICVPTTCSKSLLLLTLVIPKL